MLNKIFRNTSIDGSKEFTPPSLDSFQWVVGTKKGPFLVMWANHLVKNNHKVVIVDVKDGELKEVSGVEYRSCSTRRNIEKAKEMVNQIIQELKDGQHEGHIVIIYPLDSYSFENELNMIKDLKGKSPLIVAVNADFITTNNQPVIQLANGIQTK